MSISCIITTNFPLGDIRQLLETEIQRTHERSHITIEERDGNTVVIIDANDVGALRASLNGVTSVLTIYEKTGALHGN